ncbi:MAG TPA: DUF2067 domain-containing protein [Fervidicoccus fontis]|uniref:DUF2067 domain-containing protein n=1 Tax=Fervidicoccus fontis TaxID=683846 RepID=A0A7C2YK75_9CREN|nr:MAG: hypothetical protein C0179_01875 [Fervidicoccus sp.]HEU98211.1 DUF2067 domain-containing protein [Fervidicoccus fontis]
MVVKRKIAIRIPEGADLEKFLEEVISSISSQEAFYKIKGNVIELKIVGDPISVERSIDAVKKVVSSFIPDVSRGKITVVNLSQSAKTLGVPVPIDSFKVLLKILNVEVDSGKEEVIIHESIERVREIAGNFFANLKASRTMASGKAAELIAVLSTAYEALPDEILEIGKKLEAFKDEGGKAYLAIGWDEALKSIQNELT